ncbi:MAG: ATP-binding cassette domain-containing protein [Spirochaetales bacterium]|nr:ATP-binding cassette domain-containing protein [Spirochaetales bacterium]
MISIQDLTKYYGSNCAVDHINMEISKGEIVGLLGPNGAGKTTTLRILTCYMKPTSGDITVKDYNIHENPIEIKNMIGYLPESAPLYHQMMTYDYLQLVGDIRNIPPDEREKRIEELADLCGIREIMHKNINELSKGYKQRVGLAHAMMSDPEILVLDEPTSGLDPNQIIEVREIIKEIGKTKTILFSTHILSEAEATCNRIVIINQGKIVADKPTEILLQTANVDYSLSMTLMNADFPSISSKIRGIEGVSDIKEVKNENNSLSLQIFCNTHKDIREDIYKTIKSTDSILLEFTRESASLENVFRKLTKEN